jgi:hypothetical protein
MRETLAALETFERYYAMGDTRSLAALAKLTGRRVATLGKWSAAHRWQERARARKEEEIDAARSAARKEAATLARRRLRNAQVMQDSALIILARADLATITPEEARSILSEARALLAEGMKAERLELGETTENITPPKPLALMSADELNDYIARLEKTG